MDITLKQAEIESAVRTYVAEKIGINLTGKNLKLNFSMGRGAGNLSAFLAIEDASETQVPGFTDRDADAPQSADILSLPTTGQTGSGENAAASTLAADVTQTEKSVPTDTVEAAQAPEADDEPVKVEEKTDDKTETKPATTGGIFG